MINIIRKNYFQTIDQFDFQNNQTSNLLGTGSFGVVKLATHKGTNKKYAIKIINLNLIKNDYQLKIIQRQIKIHSCLDHPHIIKLWDTLVKNSIVYMIMEYSENGNLFYYQNIKSKFNEIDAFKFFYQVVKGLQYLHRQNYIHRDIKPQNILLDHNFNLSICDFGWSAQQIHRKRTTFCGTHQYMAPQMINQNQYDYKVDIWSLGILLYELLHGFAPFKGQNLQIIKKQIQKQNYKLNENLSEDVKSLIVQILQIDSQKRIQIDSILKHNWILKMKNINQKKNKLKDIKLLTETIEIENKYKNNEMVNTFNHKKSDSDNNFYSSNKKKNKNCLIINNTLNGQKIINNVFNKSMKKKQGFSDLRCKTLEQSQFLKLFNKQNIAKQTVCDYNSPKLKKHHRLETQNNQKHKKKQKKTNMKLSQTLKKLNSEYIKTKNM